MPRKLAIVGFLAVCALLASNLSTVWGYGKAQNFTLLDLQKKPVTLSSLKGSPVVLCFYFLG